MPIAEYVPIFAKPTTRAIKEPDGMTLKINILSQERSGLAKDTKLLSSIFEDQGWHVTVSNYRSLKRFSPLKYKKYDLNIFTQRAKKGWFRFARKNVFIPNPEWLKEKYAKHLHAFDAVFCKTRCAVEILKNRNDHTVFIGFTSNNMYDPTIEKREDRWLHIGGKSSLKGTGIIIDTWMKNPHFPHLTVIYRDKKYQGIDRPNLTYISDYIDDSRLIQLMNECAVHLCPSITEGFGHTIGEALSCGALVISTDAPPMNELINPGRGILIKPVEQKKLRFADTYFIDQKGLEKAVEKTCNLENKKELMLNAFNFFSENDSAFKERIIKEINKLFGIQ